MTPPVGAPPTSQRERILDVALRLMADQGAAATSMRKLATACNLNVAAIYHYFPSKADLLRSVIEERQYGLRLRDLPEIDRALPVRERLVALILAVGDGVGDEEQIWRLLLGETLRGDPTAAAVGRDIIAVLEPALTAWLVELFPPEPTGAVIDHAAVASVLLAQIFSYFITRLFQPPATRASEARRAAEAIATLALAPRS